MSHIVIGQQIMGILYAQSDDQLTYTYNYLKEIPSNIKELEGPSADCLA